jgi:asparagine synthase (glutamine-hydrolysing)
MSGGLDSPTLAATALSLFRERSSSFVLHAFTSVYDRLIPDAERYYAGLVADHLDVPISYDARDDETSIVDWDRLTVRTAEPIANPAAFAASLEFLRRAAIVVPVFLYGEGPDNALQYEWRRYIGYLAGKRRIGRLIRSLMHDLAVHRRVPLWGSIRHVATSRFDGGQWRESYPLWLNEQFAADFHCQERWECRQHGTPSTHPIRPAGHGGFAAAADWQSLFEDCDITGAMSQAEFRHPFLDLRLLRYMLAVPAMPWCRNKMLIRTSMRSRLPRQVLRRKKSSLPTSPDLIRVTTSGFPRLAPSPALLTYVQPDKVPSAPKTPAEFRAALRPLGLNYWLRCREAN